MKLIIAKTTNQPKKQTNLPTNHPTSQTNQLARLTNQLNYQNQLTNQETDQSQVTKLPACQPSNQVTSQTNYPANWLEPIINNQLFNQNY